LRLKVAPVFFDGDRSNGDEEWVGFSKGDSLIGRSSGEPVVVQVRRAKANRSAGAGPVPAKVGLDRCGFRLPIALQPASPLGILWHV